MSDSVSPVLPPEAVAAIKKHMNEDHAAHSLVICQALGGQPGATSAVVREVDTAGITFEVNVSGRALPVRLAWPDPIRERAQVRTAVVRLYHDACTALGIMPDGGEAEGAGTGH